MLGFVASACKAKLDRVLRQFALGLLQLILQAAQHALAAAAVVVVVFHKVHIHAGDLVEILLVEAFKKEAPRIAKDLGLEDEQVGDVGGGDGVGHGGSMIDRKRIHQLCQRLRDDTLTLKLACQTRRNLGGYSHIFHLPAVVLGVVFQKCLGILPKCFDGTRQFFGVALTATEANSLGWLADGDQVDFDARTVPITLDSPPDVLPIR